MIRAPAFATARPPCSVAERELAELLASRFRELRLGPLIETFQAPTSPTWRPLLRALLRIWAVAFLAAFWPTPAIVLAGLAIVIGLPAVAGLLRFVPGLGATTQNVVAHRAGMSRGAKPVVVVAHCDTHPTADAPMGRLHSVVAAASGGLAFAAAVAGRPGLIGWRAAAAFVAGESILTLAWLARRELAVPEEMPDDNTSGVLALIRIAELLSTSAPARDVWIVASGAGTSGSCGAAAFLRRRRELRKAWLVEVDALGAGEVVASPVPARFPYPGTPPALVRAIANAARETGDPLNVRRMRRPHSDAAAALRMRTPAIALTGGLRPPAGGPGPDHANAERAARVIDRLVRLAA